MQKTTSMYQMPWNLRWVLSRKVDTYTLWGLRDFFFLPLLFFFLSVSLVYASCARFLGERFYDTEHPTI